MHVSNDHQSDNIIFLDVVEGVDKKGHIYGLGPEAGKYKPSTSIPFDNISPSEYEHMMTVISKMSVENMTLKEQLKTHEELIRSSKVESRLLRERSHEDSCLLREQFQKFRSLFHKAIQIYLHIDLILQETQNPCSAFIGPLIKRGDEKEARLWESWTLMTLSWIMS
ncbi:hypothetical protein MTR_2g026970 [Medicago truncatula]|uniref:Uncharacterized protein n=1 Tax=Medicago truncatula TaxID=3880 RepID=Q2HV16_MEDTR|nr:hypothetical protein MtrDRAFT_AC149032g20v2 [Medicago truncatula]AES64549.1 hypothetical protein MTR_2g026970 [Medicago truncatula]